MSWRGRFAPAAALLALGSQVACDDALLGAPLTDARVYTPDWDGVTEMVEDHCVVCHEAGGSAESLPLPGAIQGDLHFGSGALVVPFRADDSKLWRVIHGNVAPGDFGLMPIGSPLADNQVDHVRMWIEDGAPYPALEVDLDGDGALDGDDCNDQDAAIHPGADEHCDGVDEDCDGEVDNDAVDGAIWYPDADGDGFGDSAGATRACVAPPGHVVGGGDCDDTDTAYNPGGPETDCSDPNDYNCDGIVGQVDTDGDGFFACEECNDTDPSIHPDATEVCDGLDNDCVSGVDQGAVDAPTWYADVDGDGYGDEDDAGSTQCSQPPGAVLDNTDCDDAAAAVNPGVGLDLPNGADDDCDGFTDEDSPPTAGDVQAIWDNNCLGNCHVAFPNPSGGLSLEDGYASTVGVASDDVPSMDLIAPGSPSDSYLWHKLQGTQGSVGGAGGQMPAATGGPPGAPGSSLPPADLALIEAWILGGALP